LTFPRDWSIEPYVQDPQKRREIRREEICSEADYRW